VLGPRVRRMTITVILIQRTDQNSLDSSVIVFTPLVSKALDTRNFTGAPSHSLTLPPTTQRPSLIAVRLRH
jgi:hypothetical protein